jgi:sulfite oxidase
LDPPETCISQVKVSGYAVSGGGRGIERVDVSVDGGKTWMEASRYQKTGIPYIADGPSSDKWAWVFFEVTIDVTQSTEIVAKAVCFVSSDNNITTCD